MPAAPKRGELFARQRRRCYYCGCGCTLSHYQSPHQFTVDHKIPKSKGGRSFRPNLVGACWSCNNLKGSMTAYEFVIWLNENKHVDLKGRAELLLSRKERRKRVKDSVAHLPAYKKPTLPKPPVDLSMIFTASLGDVFPVLPA